MHSEVDAGLKQMTEKKARTESVFRLMGEGGIRLLTQLISNINLY